MFQISILAKTGCVNSDFPEDQGQVPIYVRNSRQLSHPVQDEIRCYTEQQLYSETNRHKLPSDTRYHQKAQWQGSSHPTNFYPQMLIAVCLVPDSSRSSYFGGDPNVVFRVKSVNYYYNSDAKGHELDYASRQVFVSGR